MSKWRRYEVLIPVQLNDGSPVPTEMIGEATEELAEEFEGMNLDQQVQGLWHHQGVVYHDKLIRLNVDFSESPRNRRWMREFKARWKERLEQLEIWMISFRIEVE